MLANQIISYPGRKLERLKILYLLHNEITEIKGLDNLKSLDELHLQHNKITEIKGLDRLSKLRTLHLHDNQITELKGLENLILFSTGHSATLKLENNPFPRPQGVNMNNTAAVIEYCRKPAIHRYETQRAAVLRQLPELFKTRPKIPLAELAEMFNVPASKITGWIEDLNLMDKISTEIKNGIVFVKG
nr:leucine-rich repeat domain-containing protein [Candidatus Sigynarchaeota archaeon]